MSSTLGHLFGTSQSSEDHISAGEDVTEPLLSTNDEREQSGAEADSERDAYTHEEILHSIGSFSAVVWPVTVTMLLSSLISVNLEDPATAEALANQYLVYRPDSESEASSGTKFADAMINALVIVCFFLVATFVIAFCYKLNFHRFLIGYMMFSSAMLLGLLGGNLMRIILVRLEWPMDIFTAIFTMYNFAVVGVVSIFYQKGTPMWLSQAYLVATSVVMAWQLGQFPEWSTWALVVVLAFYDLCAVLTPCGPLKLLVNLVEQEGRPLPGLLYEAEVHGQSRSTSRTTDYSGYYQLDDSASFQPPTPPTRSPTEEAPLNTNATETTSDSPRTARIRQRLLHFYSQYNPEAIDRIDLIIERYREDEAQLWQDLLNKYAPEEPGDNTIKLGLGDFVFYSVLVSRAAMFDFAAMVSCLISVLTGLCGTLILLGIYKSALPALPISILLAVSVYFWLRLVFMDFADSALRMGILF